jgi:hypothetical protein
MLIVSRLAVLLQGNGTVRKVLSNSQIREKRQGWTASDFRGFLRSGVTRHVLSRLQEPGG